MDGFESPNDFAVDDNCCKDTEAIQVDSGYDDKSPEIDEGCHGLHELVESVDLVVEPKIGMVFDTAEKAYNFYNGYARIVGFSVRKQRTNRSKADHRKMNRQLLVCACEGSYTKIKTPKKRREIRRFNCKAMFEFKLVDGDKYRVIKFISEHSHDLVPPQCSHFLRSQRKIDFSQVGPINKMLPSGLEQSNIFSYMCAESGGTQHLNSIRSDCNNLVQRTNAEFFKRGDAQYLLDYFKEKKQKKKHFVYTFRTNEECEICGVFFCDAKSRRDYGLFGDVVCFDTTFRTNNYNMICALIVGINNHGQTTLFGCGLLDCETTDAVVWLFTTFLEVMGGKKPISIFTDQSKAISDAISVVFPESHHGLFLGHIYENAAKHLAKVFTEFKSFAPQFKACIYDSETIVEFEQSWDKLLEDYGLKDNEWLRSLYELRQKWAQTYSRVHFCASMTTTQKNESIYKFLNDYFGNTTVLRKFVDHYSKAMANQCKKEREAENETQQTSPIFISGWSVEHEAAEKYTREMFYCFQEEYQQTIDLLLELEKDDGTIRTYRAIEMEGRRKNRTLTYNHSEQSASCTCRKFEINGILCSHVLKLFRDLQYKSLPPQYYLKRWTRTVTDEAVFDSYGDLIPNDIDPSSTARYSELSHVSQRIVATGSKLKEVCSLTKSAMLDLEAKVEVWTKAFEERKLAIQKNTSESHNNLVLNLNEEAPLRDPTMRRSRGQPKERVKHSLETKIQKKILAKSRGSNTENEAMPQATTEASNIHQSTQENVAITQAMTGASNIHQSTQEAFGLVQQPSYSYNTWQGMYPRGIYPQGVHPQGICPPYSFMGSQRGPFLPNELLMTQHASSSQDSQLHAPQEML